MSMPDAKYCPRTTTLEPSPLQRDIAAAINRHSAENGSDTPDFVLGALLSDVLRAFDRATQMRDQWHGFEPWQQLRNAAPAQAEPRDYACTKGPPGCGSYDCRWPRCLSTAPAAQAEPRVEHVCGLQGFDPTLGDPPCPACTAPAAPSPAAEDATKRRIPSDPIAVWFDRAKNAEATVERQAQEIAEMKRERQARNAIDPVTRLHNICDAMAEDRAISPYSQEAWDAQDEAYREKCADLAAALRRAEALHTALREHAIQSLFRPHDGPDDEISGNMCARCDHWWKLGKVEHHAEGCLASPAETICAQGDDRE